MLQLLVSIPCSAIGVPEHVYQLTQKRRILFRKRHYGFSGKSMMRKDDYTWTWSKQTSIRILHQHSGSRMDCLRKKLTKSVSDLSNLHKDSFKRCHTRMQQITDQLSTPAEATGPHQGTHHLPHGRCSIHYQQLQRKVFVCLLCQPVQHKHLFKWDNQQKTVGRNRNSVYQDCGNSARNLEV